MSNSANLQAEVTNRLTLGIGSKIVTIFIDALGPLLLVTLFITAWGSDGYGRWVALTSMASYLNLLDLGGRGYVGNLLAINFSQGDLKTFQQNVSRAFSFYLFLVCMVMIFGVLLLSSVEYLPFEPFLLPSERLILLLITFSLLIPIPGGIFVVVLRSTGHFASAEMISNSFRLAEFMLYAGLLFANQSPLIVALAMAIMALLRSTAIFIYATKRVSFSTVMLSPKAVYEGSRFLGNSILFWLLSLSQAINYQGVILVISFFIGPEAVALYATHRTAAGAVRYIKSAFESPSWPEFTRLWSQDRLSELKYLSRTITRIVFLISGFGALFIWIVFPTIFPIWTNNELEISAWLLFIFLIQNTLDAGWTTIGWSLLAANHHHKLAFWSVTNALVTIIISVLLVQQLGILGVALATLMTDFIFGFCITPMLASKFLSLKVISLFRELILGSLILLVPIAIIYLDTIWFSSLTATIISGLFILVWALSASYLFIGKSIFNTLLSLTSLPFHRLRSN